MFGDRVGKFLGELMATGTLLKTQRTREGDIKS